MQSVFVCLTQQQKKPKIGKKPKIVFSANLKSESYKTVKNLQYNCLYFACCITILFVFCLSEVKQYIANSNPHFGLFDTLFSGFSYYSFKITHLTNIGRNKY